jgi:recombinational DNA repair protein (RecF pathway)
MAWGSFLLYQSPRRLYLKGVDVAEDFLSLRNSKNSLLCAANWCRALAARLPASHENNAVLSLFWGSMKNLSRGLNPLLLDARFAWRWGNIWGVAPSLEQCPGCGSSLDALCAVPRSSDGFLCRDCGRKGGTEARHGRVFYGPVSREAFGVLKRACLLPAENFARDEPEMRELISGDDAIKKEIKDAASWLSSFLTFMM